MKRYLTVALLVFSVVSAQAGIPGLGAWAYQLQDLDIAEVVANGSFDLIVMDYSSNGGESGEWSPSEIAAIAQSGKYAVAYISIGEAENYRFYWDSAWESDPPAWLGPENPDWPGNYKVRFWDPAWRDIVFAYVDRILAQGFDGLYLDIVDAYYYWSEENPENPQADADMAQLVLDLRAHLDSHAPGKLLIPQNGSYIVVEDDVAGILDDAYFAAIDAIGVEDVFYRGEADEDNPYDPDTDRLAMLAEYRARGKTVLSVEYLTQPAAIEQYIQAASAEGFRPHATRRALDVLSDGILTGVTITPGAFGLSGPWPNPFNPRVNFRLTLEQPAAVRVEAYDAAGRRVDVVLDETLPAGSWDRSWTAPDDLPSGVYWLRADAGAWESTTKAILLK